MSDSLLIVSSQNAWLAGASAPHPATLEVSLATGKIVQIHKELRSLADYPGLSPERFISTGDKWLLPGLLDCHVHLNEPGRTEWEGFATGTAAAASGGVTTVVDMPLNAIPPTTTVENLNIKIKASEGQCRVDVGFWGGVIPGNENDLAPLTKAGVKGVKCFLIESGVDEFPCVNEEDILKAIPPLLEANSLFLFHAELDSGSSHDNAVPSIETLPTSSYSTFLSSRPQSLELSAISLITRLQSRFPTLRTHIVHLSASSALPLIRKTRAAGLPMTVETCFHYLVLSAEEVDSTLFKCCPPVREELNRDLLWAALLAGDIDFVVSDHSPCTTELKKLESGDFMQAWGGIGGLGLGLSLLWTEAKRRGAGMGKVLEWLAVRPAKQVGLQGQKGELRVGADADFIVFDHELEFTVTKSEMFFKNKSSPYEGRKVKGAVMETFLRGSKIYDRTSGFEGLAPSGRLLL